MGEGKGRIRCRPKSKAKRRLSAAGRKATSEVTKKRWAQKRAQTAREKRLEAVIFLSPRVSKCSQ